jgi:hypothetical protein
VVVVARVLSLVKLRESTMVKGRQSFECRQKALAERMPMESVNARTGGLATQNQPAGPDPHHGLTPS